MRIRFNFCRSRAHPHPAAVALGLALLAAPAGAQQLGVPSPHVDCEAMIEMTHEQTCRPLTPTDGAVILGHVEFESPRVAPMPSGVEPESGAQPASEDYAD